MHIGRGGMVVAALILACGDGGDDDGGGGTMADSGSGSGSDASGLTDGGGDPDGPDGGRVDASGPGSDGAVDASSPDAAAPGLITVTVEWAPYPVDEAIVFFLRSDDSIIDVVSTDADGRAQAYYEEPGAVVIQFGVGIPTSQQALLAYLNVAPGTSIYSGAPAGNRSGTVTVSGPAPDAPLSFAVETACGSGDAATPPVTANLDSCRSETHAVWVARETVDGQTRTSSAFLSSVPVQDGAIAAVKGPLRADRLQMTRVTGLPDVESVAGRYRILGPHGAVQEAAFHDLAPVDGTVKYIDAFHDLRGLGLSGNVVVSVARQGINVIDYGAWVEHDGAPDVDLGPVTPPVLAGSVFDRSSATWTWTLDSPGFVTSVRGTLVVEEPDEQLYYWRVLAPDDGTPLRIPRLPPPFDRFNVDPDSTATSSELELLGHTRGHGAIVADVEGVRYVQGQAGDIAALTYGLGDVIE